MGRVPVCTPPGHTGIVSTYTEVIRSPWHLARRFVTSLPATPPRPADEAWADRQLLDGERSLWVRLSNQDRRHSIEVARRFCDARPQATRAEIAGALLHDVGKVRCGLGTFGRVVATVVGPRTERFRRYHDHEAIGARLVAEVGSDQATVDLVAERGAAYPVLEVCDY